MKVCPGIVDTKFREHVLAGSAPGPAEDIRRVVSPDTVAAALMRGAANRIRFMSLDFFAPRIMDQYLGGKMN